jgi:hypothetical protein
MYNIIRLNSIWQARRNDNTLVKLNKYPADTMKIRKDAGNEFEAI